jgi:hypothetical protein
VAGETMNDKLTDEPKTHVAPRSPAEELIAEIYALSLKDAPQGVYDDITGLDASQAAWVRQCLQQIFHVDIPLYHFLLHTTIDSLVNLLLGLWGGREIVEEIAWTFLQIEKLSDSEVKEQLAKEVP